MCFLGEKFFEHLRDLLKRPVFEGLNGVLGVCWSSGGRSKIGRERENDPLLLAVNAISLAARAHSVQTLLSIPLIPAILIAMLFYS